MSNSQRQFPESNRLSILVGTILLAYSLTQFVTIPTQEIEFSILGIIFPIRMNFSNLVAIIVAGLTASGSAWLLEDHPASDRYQTSAVHWLIPSLTSLVLLLAIDQLPLGGTWWLAVGLSGLVLTLVMVSEYIVIDSSNQFFVVAELIISSIAIVLFLILAIALHAAETRLFYRVPMLSVAALLVYLRVIHLRKEGIWALATGSVPFLLIGELASGLHYWPISPIGFGIALTGPLYALIEINDLIKTKINLRNFIWPLTIIILSWASAFFL
jgi:hypothetical protein